MALLIAMPVWAVAPSLSTITPRGGQRGTELELTFHGGNLADASGLLFHTPGISMSELVSAEAGNVKCKLAIAAECSPGIHAIRVVTRSGVSNLKLFSVGNLTEVAEVEPNNVPEEAPLIALNSTVNGVVTNEDVDFYAVELEAGARLSVEVEALRLGDLLFDPKLRLFSPHGHELVAEDDTTLFRQDAGFVHVAEEAGKYMVAISEASYGGSGNSYYRLHLGTFPRPMAVLPLGGQPNTEVNLHWFGDPGIQDQTLTLPESPLGEGFILPANDSGIAPTPFPFRYSSYPTVVEVEPNDAADGATKGTVPGSFDGVLETAGDVDYYSFDAVNGQVFDVRAWARGIGSPLDSVVDIRNAAGGSIFSNDDGAGLDSAGRITIPEDGAFTVSVQDKLGYGGPGFFYRLEFTPVAPSLWLSFIENDPVSVTIPQGNQVFLRLSASRSEFDGELNLSFENLSEGITAHSNPLPAGQTLLPLLLTAAPDAPIGATLTNIIATQAGVENPVSGGIKQEVVLIYGDNQTTFYQYTVERLALTVGEPAPFTLEIVSPKTPVVRRGRKPVTIRAHRAEGFASDIALSMPWMPPGLSTGSTVIKGDQTETVLNIECNNDAPLGPANLVVVGSGANFVVCSPYAPLEVAEPFVDFTLAQAETEQGKPTEVKVELQHRTPFEGEFSATLQGLPRGASAEPLNITKETTEIVFPITVAEDAPPIKGAGLGISTTLAVEGEEVFHYSGGGALTIFKPLPPTLAEAPAPPPEEKKPDEPERKKRFSNT